MGSIRSSALLGAVSALLLACGSFIDTPRETTATARQAIGGCDPLLSCPETEVVGLATGGRTTCAVRLDGNVRCWGYNGSGQLGDNSTTSRAREVAVQGVSRATTVAVGDAHACEVESDGSVRCWGSNSLGQLGDGTTTTRGVARAVSGLSGATAVVAGTWHTCALLSGGSVRCWGSNLNGVLGDGTTTARTTPAVVVGLTGVVSLTAGLLHNCAALSNGTVRCWGSNASGQLGDGTTTSRSTPVPVPGITTAVEVVAGSGHTCARLSDGTVRCWGRDDVGQLGNGSTSAAPVTTPVTATGPQRVARLGAGNDFTCAITDGRDGAGTAMGLWCWGGNGNGQLADGTTVGRPTPVFRASAFQLVRVAGGNGHACTLDRDGEVRCAGLNNAGQFGNGSTASASTSTASDGAAQVLSLQPESWSTMGRRYVLFDQSIWTVRRGLVGDRTVHPALSGVADVKSYVYPNTAFPSGTVQVVGSGYVWALTSSGALWSSTNPAADEVLSFAIDTRVSGVTSIEAGYGALCAVLSDRTVRCFAEAPSSATTTPSVTGVVGLAMGQAHTCALDASGVVRCWGTASDGTVTQASAPRTVSLPATARQIDSMSDTTCALLADGTVSCWQRTGVGSAAARVAGVAGATQLSAGVAHACVRNADGTASCWGANTWGQLGRGVVGAPDAVAAAVGQLSRAVEVRAGIESTCARRVDGSVRCWGLAIDRSDSARLGDGSAVHRGALTPMRGASSVATVVAPSNFVPACVVDTAGNVQRIDNVSGRGLVGVAEFGRVLSFAASGRHQCVATTGGAVQCVGGNDKGQLGDGSTVDRTIAVTLAGLNGATQAAVGSAHSCALVAGSVWCWGDNTRGQLGDGTTTSRSLPVWVLNGAAAISARDESTCAVLSTGGVRCWGADATATPTEPSVMRGLTARAVIAGSPACAIVSDRTVRCWGANAPPSSELAGFTSVDRFDHASHAECGVRTDGTLFCAARSVAGRVIVGVTDAADVTMTDFGVWVVRRGGSALALGDNYQGGLGEGSSLSAVYPRPLVFTP